MKKANYDEIAYESAEAIMKMYFEPMPGIQLKAKIQLEILEAIARTHPAPSQPSAEALVQAALEAAIDACAETPVIAGRTWHHGTGLAVQQEMLAAIRALSSQQIIESCKEKS